MASSVPKTNRPREDIKVLFDHELVNAPGKSIIGVHLDYPPDGFTPPHRHGGATVVAYVLAGELLSGMNGNPPKVYTPGQSFVELPGCHHTVGENTSKTTSTQAIAIFVVDTDVVKTGGYEALTVLDEGW
ncbi:cupin domain-containing protein [Trichoderma breve]|uniref:Cupin domain-containing protein n=1 Tax=Trichoderma breve TaxID=2034170 RepID=A0A9W9BGR6_9HYPO|nr:cupin domain-containing protein [Trichoderma breve]KAJ4859516.1 cupin domain-containing protein [Trichoderma breve]